MQNGVNVPETRRIDFGVPTALNDMTLGTDSQTAQGFTLIGAPYNVILRGILNAPPNTTYELVMTRDGKEVRRIPSSLLAPTLQGPVWVSFPITVRPGQVQFWLVQKTGTLAAATVDLIWMHSLITVVS